MPANNQQHEFPFAPEARDELLREAFEMGDLTWASAARRRHTVRLFRAISRCPAPATAELLAARMGCGKTTARATLELHIGWGTIVVSLMIGAADRAVRHHAIHWESVTAWARGFRPASKVRNPHVSPDSDTQVQATAMEPGKKTAGEQVPVAQQVRERTAVTTCRSATATEPAARELPPKDLERSFTSHLHLTTRSPVPPRSEPPIFGRAPAAIGELAGHAVAQAVAAMPSQREQQDMLLDQLRDACGEEEWPQFSTAVAEHATSLALTGIHTHGDDGFPPQFWRSLLATVRRGTTVEGHPIEGRRKYLIGTLGKKARKLGLPWPFGRKGNA